MAEVANRKNPLLSALPLGAQISCTTTQGDVLRGNIIAVDDTIKVLVIKENLNSTPSPQSLAGDVHIINLKQISQIDVISKPQNGISTDPSTLPSIDLGKVQHRLDKNVAERMKKVRSKGVNVSEKAQKLFDSLANIYNEMHWDGDVIVVMNDVRVSPPYTENSCTGSTQLIDRIMKKVAKFNEDQQPQEESV